VTLATAARSAIKPPGPRITATRSGCRGATTQGRWSSRPIPGGQLPPGHGGADPAVTTAVGAPETAAPGPGPLPRHTTQAPQHPRRLTISPRGHCTPRISHRVNSPPGRSRRPTCGPADIPRLERPPRKPPRPGIERRATPLKLLPSHRRRTSPPASSRPRTSRLGSSPLRTSPPGKRPRSAAAAGPRRRRPAQGRTAPSHAVGRLRDPRVRAPRRGARVSSGSATTMTGPAWTGTSSPTSSTGSSCLPTSRWPRPPAALRRRASPSPRPPGTGSRGPRPPGPRHPRPRPGPSRQWLGTPGLVAGPAGTHAAPHAKRQPSHEKWRPGAKRLPSRVRRQRSDCRPAPGNSRRRRGPGTAHRCRSGPTPLPRRPRVSPASRCWPAWQPGRPMPSMTR
jgi:hypothetical protein